MRVLDLGIKADIVNPDIRAADSAEEVLGSVRSAVDGQAGLQS